MNDIHKKSYAMNYDFHGFKKNAGKEEYFYFSEMMKIFFSESGIKYGAGKFPAKLSLIMNKIINEEKTHNNFSVSVNSLSAVEHFSGIVQYALRSYSSCKTLKKQKKHLQLYSQATDLKKEIESHISFLKKKECITRKLASHCFNKKENIENKINFLKNTKNKLNDINNEIENINKIKEKTDEILIYLKAPFFDKDYFNNQIKKSVSCTVQFFTYLVNYTLKFIKDMIKISSLFTVKSTTHILKFVSHVIGVIVYPVSLFLTMLKTFDEIESLDKISNLYKKIKNNDQCHFLKKHILSKKNKLATSVTGNLLSTIGYLFASVSAICSLLIPGATAIAAILTPVGWGFAGAGAFVLLILLVYRLVKYCQQSRVKQLCLDVLNNKEGSHEKLIKNFKIIKTERQQLIEFAQETLCNVSAKYTVLHLVTLIRKSKQQENQAKSSLSVFLEKIVPKQKERDAFFSRDYKDQVWLICEKMKIKSALITPVQLNVFER